MAQSLVGKVANGFLDNLMQSIAPHSFIPQMKKPPPGGATFNIITISGENLSAESMLVKRMQGWTFLLMCICIKTCICAEKDPWISLQPQPALASYVLTIHLTITPSPLISLLPFVFICPLSFASRLNSPSELIVSFPLPSLLSYWVK